LSTQDKIWEKSLKVILNRYRTCGRAPLRRSNSIVDGAATRKGRAQQTSIDEI